MTCTNCDVGKSTSNIVFDGDTNGSDQAPTDCLSGKRCLLTDPNDVSVDMSGSPYFLGTSVTKQFSCKPDRSVKAIEIKLITDNSLALAEVKIYGTEVTKLNSPNFPPSCYVDKQADNRLFFNTDTSFTWSTGASVQTAQLCTYKIDDCSNQDGSVDNGNSQTQCTCGSVQVCSTEINTAIATSNQDACVTGSTIEDPAKCIELGLKLGYVEGLSADYGADHVPFCFLSSTDNAVFYNTNAGAGIEKVGFHSICAGSQTGMYCNGETCSSTPTCSDKTGNGLNSESCQCGVQLCTIR